MPKFRITGVQRFQITGEGFTFDFAQHEMTIPVEEQAKLIAWQKTWDKLDIRYRDAIIQVDERDYRGRKVSGIRGVDTAVMPPMAIPGSQINPGPSPQELAMAAALEEQRAGLNLDLDPPDDVEFKPLAPDPESRPDPAGTKPKVTISLTKK